jgi:membrane-bound ClpP family serine protease
VIFAGILLFLALLLIFLEFYLPGGILGVAGGVLLIGAIVVFALFSPHPLLSLGFGIGCFLLLLLLVKFALQRIRHSRPESSIYLGTDQEGTKGAEFSTEMVGRDGVAATNLRPSGHIIIAEKRYQAVAQMGFISKGERVKVIGGEGGHLIVKRKVTDD